jgi:putative ABC transport system permease protein
MDTHDVLTLRVALPFRKYNTPDKALQFFDRAVKKVIALPGVRSAGMISYLPFASLGAATAFTVVGQPPPPPGQDFVTDVSVCDNGYFQTLRVPLVRGRLFTEREQHETSNIVIINEALARRYFPGADPLGESLVINMNNPNVPTAIVGVVGSSKFTSLESETRPAAYWPHPQLAYTSMTLTVRTASDPTSFAPLVQREIQSIDQDQPVSDVRTMDQWVERTLARERFSSFLLLVFASLAVLLAAIGIYGVMSYAVSQRTPEIGVRLALGAERRDIMRLIVGNGARLAALGVGIGVPLALALGRAIASLLFETTSADPTTFAAVVLLLGSVALVASYVPARRAARIAPTEALHYQ